MSLYSILSESWNLHPSSFTIIQETYLKESWTSIFFPAVSHNIFIQEIVKYFLESMYWISSEAVYSLVARLKFSMF